LSEETIVAIGEALWDVFPDRRRPGGAPCNVAFHAARLGDRGAIVTRVGADAPGDELVAFLGARGVDTAFVQRDHTRPTGTVTVTVEHDEPRYDIAEDVAWDYIAADDAAVTLVGTASAVCVGSLAQRSPTSRAAHRQLVTHARDQAVVVFDVNLRPPFIDPDLIDGMLRLADVVKVNEWELTRLSTLLAQPSLEQWLLHDVGVQAVCVTREHRGASISTREGTVSTPGTRIDASTGDPVGAGDAFTAAMAHQLIRHAAPQDVIDGANRYAALVASKKGAMPDISADELAEIGL
jgi:fructokinase